VYGTVLNTGATIQGENTVGYKRCRAAGSIGGLQGLSAPTRHYGVGTHRHHTTSAFLAPSSTV